MISAHAAPVLLALLVGILLSLLGWGAARQRVLSHSESHENRDGQGPLAAGRDDLLMGLLVLAAFSLGVFLTYLFITAV
jgi:hypothetical protein